ncbi:hypothetical protein C8F04DRAFT_881030, partial [Mycena alexandri]
LCPFCEAPLPTNPSETLLNMLQAAEGRTLTTLVIAPLCAQHEFEANLLPMAI